MLGRSIRFSFRESDGQGSSRGGLERGEGLFVVPGQPVSRSRCHLQVVFEQRGQVVERILLRLLCHARARRSPRTRWAELAASPSTPEELSSTGESFREAIPWELLGAGPQSVACSDVSRDPLGQALDSVHQGSRPRPRARTRVPWSLRASHGIDRPGHPALHGYKGHRDRLPEPLDGQVQTLRLEPDEDDSVVVCRPDRRGVVRVRAQPDRRGAPRLVGVRAPPPQIPQPPRAPQSIEVKWQVYRSFAPVVTRAPPATKRKLSGNWFWWPHNRRHDSEGSGEQNPGVDCGSSG
jgi:hypothetical protein